jgi:hypothetical protein
VRLVGSSASGDLADAREGSGRRVPPMASPASSHSDPADDVTFSFDPDFAAVARDRFIADFRNELASVRAWSVRHGWPADAARLQVFVSDRYKISKSLVPAWYGHPGHLEFPARRVIIGEAAIAHELVHVYWPNGNRLLAEGLAVCVQAAIAGNPAFPNFGRPLHQCARASVRVMAPAFACGNPAALRTIKLVELDRIPTPNPLTLQVGCDFFGEDRRGQSALYLLAGSFVQFLIDSRGLAKFRSLYQRTPFLPGQQNSSAPERWNDVYGQTLDALEAEWLSLLANEPITDIT